jgi:hypothetical protein
MNQVSWFFQTFVFLFGYTRRECMTMLYQVETQAGGECCVIVSCINTCLDGLP